MNRMLATAMVVGAMSGCASPIKPQMEQRLAGVTAYGPVQCTGCVTEWQRAQLWLAQHSVWRLQTATDVMLTTYSPTRSEPSYGFQVLKTPLGENRFEIAISAVCGNLFGCQPDLHYVTRAFYHYVQTGQDVLAGAGYLSGIR